MIRGVMDVDKCHLCRNHNMLAAGTFDMTIKAVKRNFKGLFSVTLHLAELENKTLIRDLLSLVVKRLKFRSVERSMPPTGFFIPHGIMLRVRIFITFSEQYCSKAETRYIKVCMMHNFYRNSG